MHLQEETALHQVPWAWKLGAKAWGLSLQFTAAFAALVPCDPVCWKLSFKLSGFKPPVRFGFRVSESFRGAWHA